MSFRDQAMIAIENARLFNETREALETADRDGKDPSGHRWIADRHQACAPAVAESACAVCDAYDGAVLLREGGDLLFSAHHGPIRSAWSGGPSIATDGGRAVVDRATVHRARPAGTGGRRVSPTVGTVDQDGASCHRQRAAAARGRGDRRHRAAAQGDAPVYRPADRAPADVRDQAIIAINNVQLFDEVQAKTHDLSEALEQQTATPRCLKVIQPLSLQHCRRSARRCWNRRPNFAVRRSACCSKLENDVLRPGARLRRKRAVFVDFHARTPLPIDRTSIADGR